MNASIQNLQNQINELQAALQVRKSINTLTVKADDNAVVHLAGTETVTGSKTFSAGLAASAGAAAITSTNTGGGGFQYILATTGAAFTGKIGITTAGVMQFNHNNITSLLLDAAGNAALQTVGAGLRTKEGTNAKQGTAVLIAGALVVANTSVTANSRIFLTSQVDGGTPGFLRVSARVAGTSFTITSSNVLDTSTVAYEIFEPS